MRFAVTGALPASDARAWVPDLILYACGAVPLAVADSLSATHAAAWVPAADTAVSHAAVSLGAYALSD